MSVFQLAEGLDLKIKDVELCKVQSPQILIAGCGTGQHSIEAATRYKNCNVLAIDLSLRSLAYAKRKTEELGINNIKYMQADILDLLKLGRQFDIIESAGVLHHMGNPMEGWKVLTDCLKLGGLMRIGLYSATARASIVRVRKEIAKAKKIDPLDMKIFRRKLIKSKHEHHKLILLSPDFFNLSSLRDLLFHVQEHRFTLPQIENYLSELALDFCGFESPTIVKKYKLQHQDPDDLFDLKKWDAFEKENPHTFSRMYQFWCQKNT